jgi:ribokinase
VPDITVFGSLNTDLVLKVPGLPAAGETVLGADLRTFNGGKGANQAVAAARQARAKNPGQPVSVRMVGRVGADDYGRVMREDLAAEGVDVTALDTDPTLPSGLAMILVDPAGENTIAVAPGANANVGAADVGRAGDGLRPGDIVVCQLEVPMPAVRALADAVRTAGARLVCNAAPAARLGADLLAALDVLIVNETEADMVLGAGLRTPEAAAEAAARNGCALVVTLGGAGAVYADPAGTAGHCPAPTVTVVDTVGAGDAFVGAFAVSLASGGTLADAVAAGVTAGSHAVSQPGARTTA